jgi:hypothetical protein
LVDPRVECWRVGAAACTANVFTDGTSSATAANVTALDSATAHGAAACAASTATTAADTAASYNNGSAKARNAQ